MSMDEFLANIWNSDENLISEPTKNEAKAALNTSAATTEPTTNPLQASFSLPPPVRKKTLDKVWSEIHKSQPQQNESNCDNPTISGTLRKQQSLGEMTLEGFLIKAGIVKESSLSFKSFPSQSTTVTSFPNQTSTIASMRPLEPSYGSGPPIGVGFSTQQNVGNYVPNNAFAPYPMFPQSNSFAANGPKASCVAAHKLQNVTEPNCVSTKKRFIDSPPEVVVERRQRRMLKNRESAARSRARRQAYTVELEAELTQLRQENDMLKQVLAEADKKRKKEAALRKHSTKAEKRAEKLRAIRRTVSAPW